MQDSYLNLEAIQSTAINPLLRLIISLLRSLAVMSAPSERLDEIDAFFAQYPKFTYRRGQPFHSEFYRMCDFFTWKREDSEREGAWKQFRIALIQAFNSTVGVDAQDLASWQRICRCLGIVPMPTRLHQAQQVSLRTHFGQRTGYNITQAVTETHVNLVDLLGCIRSGSAVKIFSTVEDLRVYTVQTGRYFPKEQAYAGGLLRFLLREILNDYGGSHGPRGTRRHRSHHMRPGESKA